MGYIWKEIMGFHTVKNGGFLYVACNKFWDADKIQGDKGWTEKASK